MVEVCSFQEFREEAQKIIQRMLSALEMGDDQAESDALEDLRELHIQIEAAGWNTMRCPPPSSDLFDKE